MKALVLSAGKSTRISSVAGNLPKPLIRIGDTTILERTLSWLADHDVTDIYINLHYQPELIKQTIGDGRKTGSSVKYVMEPEILGTAGAVKNIEDVWTSDFLVVYGDNILGFDISDMILQHRESTAIATIAVFDWDSDAHSGIAGGRVLVENNRRITGFAEHADGKPESNWVNAGVYILSPQICDFIPSGQYTDFGHDVFPKLLKNNFLIEAYPINSYCLAVDTPEAYERTLNVLSDFSEK